MTRTDIEKTRKGNLMALDGHENLLVSFGGIQQGLGVPVFEFFNSISDIPCDKIFFRDFHQAWYQKGVDSELDHIDKISERLEKLINENNYKKISFIGNSMGGYASILFGTILNVDTVISFAPQTYIDRFNRLISLDSRWKNQIRSIYKLKENKKDYFDLRKHLSMVESYKTEINIYYSVKHRLDKRHAERLRKVKNIRLHPMRKGGHSVVKVLRESNQLETLIKRSF